MKKIPCEYHHKPQGGQGFGDDYRFVPDGCCWWCGKATTDGSNFCCDEHKTIYLKRKIAKGLKRYILNRDGYRCQKCGRDVSMVNKFGVHFPNTIIGEIHHKIPLSAGGRNDTSNEILLCRDCHQRIHYGGGLYDMFHIDGRFRKVKKRKKKMVNGF